MKNVKGTKNVQNRKNQSKNQNGNHSNHYNNQGKNSLSGGLHIDITSPITLARMFDIGHKPKVVYICAPYRPLSKDPEQAAAELKENIRNTRMACTLVSIINEMPVSSSLMYPQFLNDDDPIDRKKGIDYGIRLLESSDELWIVGDRITAGMRQEIEAAKELQIPIRLMGNPYDEAEKLLQMLDELEKCIPDEDESATGADDDGGNGTDGADDIKDAEDSNESDDSWRDHVQGVFDCLMCPCSGIDSPDEFLENFERYFWTGFPECKADKDDQDDQDDSDDFYEEEDECWDNDEKEAEEEAEDDADDTDDFDDFLDDLIDALETVRDLYGEED